jgi:hypothetical protein
MNARWVILIFFLVFSSTVEASGRSGKSGSADLRRCQAELEVIRNIFVLPPPREALERKRPEIYEGRGASQRGILAIREILANFEVGGVTSVTEPNRKLNLTIGDEQSGNFFININEGSFQTWAMAIMRDSTRGLELTLRKNADEFQYRETFYEDGLAHIRVMRTKTDEKTGERLLMLATYIGGAAEPKELYRISLIPRI